MVDYKELERRVFKKLDIDPEVTPDDYHKQILYTMDLISVRNAIHVLAEYNKMKEEDQ